MTYTEMIALDRARAEVGRMRRTFELRETRPPHIFRAWCQDCEAVVELASDHRCHCGSRSVMPHGRRGIA